MLQRSSLFRNITRCINLEVLRFYDAYHIKHALNEFLRGHVDAKGLCRIVDVRGEECVGREAMCEMIYFVLCLLRDAKGSNLPHPSQQECGPDHRGTAAK